MEDSISNYLNSWNGRLRASLLDFVILHRGGYYSQETYPYSIFTLVQDEWGEESAPPLPTIYSTINRLEKENLIRIRQEISGGRVQKIVETTESGFIALESMRKDLRGVLQSIKTFKVPE